MKAIIYCVLVGFLTCMTSLAFAQSGQKFASGGNSLAVGEFLGTINDFPLYVKVNNALALTIEPGGKVKINSLSGGEGIVRYDIYGTLSQIPFSGDKQTVLLGNGHWGEIPLPENYWKIDQSTNHLYTLTPGNVGIGTQTPVMKLDVNGDAVVRGYLYVNNGVIIGKKIDSKSVYSDTLEVSEKMRANEVVSKIMYSDSLDAIKINTENIEASKEAKIGSELILDGLNSQIFSNSGLIDFKNTNLKTTGDITANRINATTLHVDSLNVSNVNTTADIVTTGNIYARRIYAEKSVSVGNFTFKNGGTVIGPGKDTIKTENRMAIVSEANSIRMVSDTVIMNDRLAIGREYAEYSLDVAGNARFQDKLIVEGGLIIGKEYQGEKGEIDSLISKEASIDTVRSENVRATEINAEERINIGSGNTIRIDGLNSQITSTTGKIDFGSNELRTSGPITGGAINMDNAHFLVLDVTTRINIGSNTLILENNPWGGLPNSIYTHSTDPNEDCTLQLQSTNLNDNNTIINYNNDGNVGIGTNNPQEKLEVNGNIRVNNKDIYLRTSDVNGHHGLGWYGNENFVDKPFAGKNVNGPVLYGYNGGALGSRQGFPPTTPYEENIALVWKSDGKVGIGTDNPQKSLHVKDIKQLSIQPDQIVDLPPIPLDPYDEVNNNAANEATGSLRLELVAGPGNQAIWDIEPVTSLSQTSAQVNKLYIGPKDKDIPVMALNYDGKVGIGTTNPHERLQIGDRWTFHNGGTKIIGYNYKYENNLPKRIKIGPVSMICFGDDGDIDFRFAPDGSENTDITSNQITGLKITNNGTVGIGTGTESPNAKLHITGISDNSAGLIVGNNPEQNSGLSFLNTCNQPHGWIRGEICTGYKATSSGWEITTPHNDYSGIRFEGAGIAFIVGRPDNTPSDATELNKVMIIQNNGNVGIGTANPNAKLCVKGTIKASEEIIVEDPATNGWADFVFDDTYKLSPLSEVESFIKTNKHLPDIPSASSVQENGVSLVDMNKRLLQKIEELTLYIIEQEKRIQKLESESNR